jgi:AcrR family transcriptional regulator
MAIIVEHEKRRREILEKALDVFVDDGFEGTTVQKIADRCTITRTTLYIYFKNKKEIFNYSIKQLLGSVEAGILLIKKDTAKTYAERLSLVFSAIVDMLTVNRRLLCAIVDYLQYLSKNAGDPEQSVRRRTIRLRHILSGLIIEGIEVGEFAPISVKDVDELLYGLLEAAVFRIALLKSPSIEAIKQAAHAAIRQLVIDKQSPLTNANQGLGRKRGEK